uniref:Putative ovule protein n=1 Tax=Solanum chacoense TaxID=4108 RepID=A0A0V0IJX9_SOLCH
MRPISLSNFINKILSKIVHDRLEALLPNLISSNQSGFVIGRSIIENVLLTQEIVTDIRKRGKPANVVIKLDMSKPYDRVSWFFLMKVLRRMGFSNDFVDLIWRLISNNWYSILINGQPHGFFNSTRGVKQGYPLSPAWFIISAEVLSGALNSLFEDGQYVGYGLPKWSAKLNHLSYAGDTIIFSSTHKYSLQRIISTLQEYELLSGEKINKDKSAFYLHQNEVAESRQLVEECTSFSRGQFPMKYVGCPISHTRKRKEHYFDLIRR